MSGPKVGRAWLLKISDGAGGFIALTGITGKSLDINGERIDATVPDAMNPEGPLWAKSLDGVRSIGFSGDGRVVNDAAEELLKTSVHGDSMEGTFQLVVPAWGTYEGVFSITLQLGDDGTVTFSITGASSGAVQFTTMAPA
ncbi:phage tail tube protein [Tritonibacter scottomollicae]|uniref:Phage tail tube protein n=1 Tax=Tritonibacter scottomollicae TaxID=483013 RepID=A0ABZ0HG07_TRISK|nr:phage tail tube protein [Tritonibacter scottomollicae]WOI32881.1 phage tail tube protein [Tritonibacter scottomollicae]